MLVQEEYELIVPRAGPLSSTLSKSLRDAGLAPSALLHFKRGDVREQRVPALKPELLASAHLPDS